MYIFLLGAHIVGWSIYYWLVHILLVGASISYEDWFIFLVCLFPILVKICENQCYENIPFINKIDYKKQNAIVYKYSICTYEVKICNENIIRACMFLLYSVKSLYLYSMVDMDMVVLSSNIYFLLCFPSLVPYSSS